MDGENSFPVASKSFYVNHESPISGARIMEAVQQVMRDCGDEDALHYYQSRRYDNGDYYRIGRRSNSGRVNIVVLADGLEWIRPTKSYAQITVQSVDRTSDRRLCEHSEHNETISFTCSFSDLLEAELAKSPIPA